MTFESIYIIYNNIEPNYNIVAFTITNIEINIKHFQL